MVPDWIGTAADGAAHWNEDAAKHDDTGLRFWAFVTTMPLTLLTLVNLFAAWRSRGEIRRWWLAAGFTALADRILTFGYFIPTMIGLMSMADSPEAVATATQWANLNYLRHALVLVAWVAAMKALTMSDSRGSRGLTALLRNIPNTGHGCEVGILGPQHGVGGARSRQDHAVGHRN